jgi:hypothetical protein
VLLAIDVAAGGVLRAVQLATLLGRDHAVGLGVLLGLGDGALLAVQAALLATGERPGRRALRDACGLVGFALVGAGGLGGERGLGRQQRGHEQGDRGKGAQLHGGVLWWLLWRR